MGTLEFLRLIPHRAPMVLVDEVTQFGAEQIRARRTVRAGDPFVTAAGLSDAALIECLAQTIAAGDAVFAKSKGGRVRVGYLTGLTGVAIHGQARIGDVIELEARCRKRMEGMGLFVARATVGDRLLVEGTFKLFVDIDYGDSETP